MNVLIIDSEEVVLEAITKDLVSIDNRLKVKTAASVTELEKLISQKDYECIFVDFNAGLNGSGENEFSLQGYLKNIALTTPLIAISAPPHVEEELKCVRTDNTSFISKPLSAQIVIDKIHEVLGSKFKSWHEGYQVNNYTIKNLISETPSSLVFTVSREDSNDTFVLKALKKDGVEFDDVTLKRFQIEIDILRKLNHPNIVNIIDYDTAALGVPYIVMPYVEGITLKECIDELSEIDFIDIMLAIAETLLHVHCRNLVHRDIKPGNIVIANSRPVLLDFGLVLVKNKNDIDLDVKFENIDLLLQSKLDDEDASVTQENAIVGTPNYMAPEAFMNPHNIDYRSDIYSLGAILYRYVYKISPYEGANVYDVIRNLMNKTDEELYRGSKYDELIKQMINKKPGLRIDSVLTLSEELYKIKQTLVNH